MKYIQSLITILEINKSIEKSTLTQLCAKVDEKDCLNWRCVRCPLNNAKNSIEAASLLERNYEAKNILPNIGDESKDN